MRKLHLPKYLRPVSWMRETGAFLLDFLFSFALGFLLYGSLGQYVLTPAFHGPEAVEAYNALALESGFMEKDEKGELHDFRIDRTLEDFALYEQYETVEERVFSYFVEAIPSSENLVFLQGDAFSSTHEKGTPGYASDAGKWTYRVFFGIEEKEPHPLWARPAEGFDYLSMPKPNASLQEKLDSEEESVRLAAHRDLYLAVAGASDSDPTALYGKAIAHFKSQPAALKAQNDLKFANYAGLYPAFILPPLIFFLLFPLLLKNGQTLGKKICKIALLGSDGYQAKTGNILAHYGVIIAAFYLFLIPYPLYSFMGFSLFMLLDYITLILSRYHQSLHAMIAHTISVDSENSIWFASKEAEMRYIKGHPSSLAARCYEEESGERLVKGQAPLDQEAFEREALGILDMTTLQQNPHTQKEEDKEDGDPTN